MKIIQITHIYLSFLYPLPKITQLSPPLPLNHERQSDQKSTRQDGNMWKTTYGLPFECSRGKKSIEKFF
jgi:hypothetical protein